MFHELSQTCYIVHCEIKSGDWVYLTESARSDEAIFLNPGFKINYTMVLFHYNILNNHNVTNIYCFIIFILNHFYC